MSGLSFRTAQCPELGALSDGAPGTLSAGAWVCLLRISQPPDLQSRLGLQEGCVDPVDEVSHPQAGFEPTLSRMLDHHAMFLLQLVL